jgi:hypothetical protein
VAFYAAYNIRREEAYDGSDGASARRAYDDLDGIAAIVSPTSEAGPAAAAPAPTPTADVLDVITVYKHAARHTKSRTPRLIELFARSQRLTPTEIGIALGNGQPLTKAQARAVLRNLQQTEGYLLKEGRISRRILVKDFAGYEDEASGRYGISDEDKAALRSHLGLD